MTMHLVGPYLTTTQYSRKKGKAKKKTASQIQAEQKHEKFLRKMGAHPDQRSEKSSQVSQAFKPTRPTTTKINSNESIPTGVAVKPEPKVYSGEQKLIGIATMHKSNMVPVFSKKNAIELAKMRRG